tara:strand:+ start:2005 stop:2157 length:153 start_codon:yes stop_codon:yes gene_type:complete
MTELAKLFEPSKDRLINNARRMMLNAKNPQFKAVWQNILVHLLKQYKKLN